MEQVTLLLDLKGLRKEVKLSAIQVGKLSGISHAHYERIEAGRAPGLGIALKLAKFLNVPVEEIWGLVEQPQVGSDAGSGEETNDDLP